MENVNINEYLGFISEALSRQTKEMKKQNYEINNVCTQVSNVSYELKNKNKDLNIYIKDNLATLELTKRNGQVILVPTSKILLMEDYKITLVSGKKIKVLEDIIGIAEELCRIE